MGLVSLRSMRGFFNSYFIFCQEQNYFIFSQVAALIDIWQAQGSADLLGMGRRGKIQASST